MRMLVSPRDEDGLHDVYGHDMSDRLWPSLEFTVVLAASATICRIFRCPPGGGGNDSVN